MRPVVGRGTAVSGHRHHGVSDDARPTDRDDHGKADVAVATTVTRLAIRLVWQRIGIERDRPFAVAMLQRFGTSGAPLL